jgi:hypothetical protein
MNKSRTRVTSTILVEISDRRTGKDAEGVGMLIKMIFAMALVVAASATAMGAPRVVTPSASGASGECTIVNVSTTKSVELTIELINGGGVVLFSDANATLLPGRAVGLKLDGAAYCAVTVRKGGKRNVRVGFNGYNASGNLVGSFEGR